MNWLKIDEVAKETGLTKRTIRYYEEIGLIKSPERSDGGIRLYTEDDVQHLKNIVVAKKVLGFSLQEIQEYLVIYEQVQEHRNIFTNLEDHNLRTTELKKMEEAVTRQINLVDIKIQEMNQVREDLVVLSERIQQGLQQ
ncbi:MerR family transcriptional regulator [Paenibacillus pini]|uniref:Cu(I)-responsive transcriptional regulator n=1 Tax=Paenibacillus pini JCM 16418 TaxID=1236976 RepID=W7Z745_9BACL|nr:MerR family transcriptional regulator [Paenibacillus pini]GAF10119.1 Cu(I)-responsive transcriptional regulator [Paenibacillus pini JCM 16418]